MPIETIDGVEYLVARYGNSVLYFQSEPEMNRLHKVYPSLFLSWDEFTKDITRTS